MAQQLERLGSLWILQCEFEGAHYAFAVDLEGAPTVLLFSSEAQATAAADSKCPGAVPLSCAQKEGYDLFQRARAQSNLAVVVGDELRPVTELVEPTLIQPADRAMVDRLLGGTK